MLRFRLLPILFLFSIGTGSVFAQAGKFKSFARNSLWGVYNSYAQDTIFPAKYKKVEFLNDSIFLLYENLKYGAWTGTESPGQLQEQDIWVGNSEGKILNTVPFQSVQVSTYDGFHEVHIMPLGNAALAMKEKDHEAQHKVGLIRADGTEVLPPAYKGVFAWKDGLVLGIHEDYCVMITPDGRRVETTDFESLSRVPALAEAPEMKFPLLIQGERKGLKYYLSPHDLKPLNPTGFESIEQFYSHRTVVTKGGKAGVINRKGEWVIPLKKRQYDGFYYGLSRFREEGLWGVVDTSGDVVLQPVYQTLEKDFGTRLWIASRNGEIYIVASGDEIVLEPNEYSNVQSLEYDPGNSLFVAFKEGKGAIFDPQSKKFLTEFRFSTASGGRVAGYIQIDGFLLDPSGKELMGPDVSIRYDAGKRLVLYEQRSQKSALADKNLTLLTGFVFDSILPLKGKTSYKVKIEGEEGFINENGEWTDFEGDEKPDISPGK